MLQDLKVKTRKLSLQADAQPSRSVASTSDSVMTFLLVCPLTYLEEYLEEDEKSSFLYLAIHGPEVNTTKSYIRLK